MSSLFVLKRDAGMASPRRSMRESERTAYRQLSESVVRQTPVVRARRRYSLIAVEYLLCGAAVAWAVFICVELGRLVRG